MKNGRAWRNLALAAVCCVLAAGCVYQVRIYQGSIIDPANIEKVELGMTREQVAYVLGTPTVSDPFRSDRWDYVFTSGTLDGRQRRVVIRFSDEGVSDIEVTPEAKN
ncbi:outer membrane protein assembly factor BamE [Candidatus Foliamicus sp.]